MKLYSVYGLLPMTKEQVIGYFQRSNELTLNPKTGRYELTGGVPFISKKDGKTYYRAVSYSGYEEYFNKMVEEGVIRQSYASLSTVKRIANA